MGREEEEEQRHMSSEMFLQEQNVGGEAEG